MLNKEIDSFEIALTQDEVREQLHGRGYANLDFHLGKSACQELFGTFKDFVRLCDEPGGDKLKQALSFDINGRGNGEYFLDLRLPGANNEGQRGVSEDHKYVMHYGAQTLDRVHKTIGSPPAEMKKFLDNCDEFYFRGRMTAFYGAKALGIDELLFPEDEIDDVHLLRVIDYIGSDNGHLGEAHFDRGVTTLAMSESHSGLRGVPADNGYLRPLDDLTLQRLKHHMEPVEHHENVAKFFAGAGLRRLPSQLRAENDLDKIPLFAHDIVNERPGENRQAVVMFFNPQLGFDNYSVPTKEETSITF